MNDLSRRWGGVASFCAALAACAFAASSATCEPEAAGAPTLTLDEAISIATGGNRLLKNAQLDVDKATSAAAVTRTKGLPNIMLTAEGSQLLSPVDFEFPKGAFGEFPVIGPVPSTDTTVTAPANFSVIANLTVLQPITQLKRVRLGVRMQEAAADVSREDVRSQQHEVVSNVKQLYYGILQLQSARETVQESIGFLTELERWAGQNVEQGTALDSDLLEVRARLAKQRHELSALDSSIATTKEKLNVVLGRDVSISFDVTPVETATVPSTGLEGLQAYALEHRPEVRQAALKTRMARDDESSKRSESTPDVSLAVTYTRFQNIAVIPDQLFTAGVLVSWKQPVDWGARREEVAEKRRTVEQADNGLLETKSQITVDVNSRYRDLQDAISLVEADRLSVEAKREKRRVTMNKYQESSALLKDVLEADTDLSDANREYLRDQLAVSTARAKLDEAIGEGD